MRRHTTRFPIEHEHAGIARHRRAHLSGTNTLLDVGQQPGIVAGNSSEVALAWRIFCSCRERLVEFIEQLGQLLAEELMRFAQAAALVER